MKPFYLDGITYDTEILRMLISAAIRIREGLLMDNELTNAAHMSMIIDCLDYQLMNLDGTKTAG